MNPQRLRPGLHRDQEQLIARADRSADAVEALIRQIWHLLLDVLETGGSWFHVAVAVRAALSHLNTLPNVLSADLIDVARHAEITTAEHLGEKLPERVKAMTAARSRLMEADFADPTEIPWEQWREAPLFEPLSLPEIGRIVYATNWRERFTLMTKLASPDALASIIATGWLQGMTAASIARQIQPALQGVQSSARRIARTEGIRVAHAIQWEMYEAVPGVIGYQIHSLHFPATRHWHAKRDGTIYYRDPKAGQKGFDKMPRPPLEADDPNERPAGTPKIAFN